MALREPRRQSTPAERAIADRVRRARPARRDKDGTYHGAICALAREQGIDATQFVDLWDEYVSILIYDGRNAEDAEGEAFAFIVDIVERGFARRCP